MSTNRDIISKRLLGVRIDYIRIYQAVEIVEKWLRSRGRHYVVTPNPEMLVDANLDKDFMAALNDSDLSIPDSSRLGWGNYVQSIGNPFMRLIYMIFFLSPHSLPRFSYPTSTGVDLMSALLRLSEEKAYTTAYLGGSVKVADKLSECLRLEYPKLKIAFCSGNVKVDNNGSIQFDLFSNKNNMSKDIKPNPGPISDKSKSASSSFNKIDAHKLSQKIDILFVAFGHPKQEKWMRANLSKLNTRIMIGVGGSFDYLSGSVPRAPLVMRNLGLEWLFRLVIQPWRIKRFWKLIYYIYKVGVLRN